MPCHPLRVRAVVTANLSPCLIYRAIWKHPFFSSRRRRRVRVSKHICALRTNIFHLIASGICKQTHTIAIFRVIFRKIIYFPLWSLSS